jgi:acyl-CoA thioester hydrolase
MGDARILPAEGRFDGVVHLFPVRVYFEDTDLSGVVYHANHLRWMERARSDMLLAAGIDQRAAFEAGEGAFAVADLAIRYRAPARLGDALTVASRVTRVGATVAIQQTVSRDTQIVSEAEVSVAFVAPNGRARRQPSAWVARFRSLVA